MAEIVIKAKGQLSLESVYNVLAKYDEQFIESNKIEKGRKPTTINRHQQRKKTKSIQ